MLANDLTVADRPLVTQIVRLYRLTLNRIPDSGGLRAYVQSLKDGRSLEELATIFLDSDEFRSRHCDADYFHELYRLSLGSAPQGARDHRSTAALIADLIETEEAETQASVLQTMTSGGLPFADGPAYPWWAVEHERISSSEMRAIEIMRSDLIRGPMISLIAIVDNNPNMGHLQEMVESVRTQLYDKLELLFVVKGGAHPSLISFLESQMMMDSRLKLAGRFRWSSRASAFNKALRIAGGNFVGQLNAHDRLAVSATLELAYAALSWPETQVLFTDEDAVTADGVYHAPRLKTDWDGDRMLVQNHLGSLSVFRTELLQRLGGMRARATGAEEFDLTLRATFAVAPTEIRHIPRILYHRRGPTRRAPTTATAGLPKGAARLNVWKPDTSLQVADAFAKQSRLATAVRRDPSTGVLRAIRRLPAALPLVSLIIPTRDRADLLRPCIEGLLERTDYLRIEVIIVDNGSREAETLALLSTLASNRRAKVLAFDQPFDWSAVNNRGVAASNGEVILLLNNDTEVVHADWLDEMVAQALRPEVGIVGAKLLYPSDGTVQHAGIVLAPNGAGRHVFRHAAGHDLGYLGQLATVRTVSAVTGACIGLRRQVFDQVGGLKENVLQVSNGDVDLCLRVKQHGYRVVWTPFARLWHKELATRGADDTPEKAKRAKRERAYLVSNWGEMLREDPYWNPNLEVTEDGAILAIPSRAQRAWDRVSEGL